MKAAVGQTPHMNAEQAERITRHILNHQPHDILELGFHHGVSTCYLAAALDELGRGHVTTIDRTRVRTLDPNIEELLEALGLRDRVTIHFEPTSYIWRLMKMLDAEAPPTFDLCYIDGAHSWEVDGFAFLLVDRMLRQDGWVVFDDLDWTFGSSPGLSQTARVRDMPAEERETPQVRKVFELLVQRHPDYAHFREEGSWAWACKTGPSPGRSPVVTHVQEGTRPTDLLRAARARLLNRGRRP